MISVTEAKKIIDQNVYPLQPAILPLQEAVGLILAENIYAEMDIPAFPQSSMDGYAFAFSNWLKNYKSPGKLQQVVIKYLPWIKTRPSGYLQEHRYHPEQIP